MARVEHSVRSETAIGQQRLDQAVIDQAIEHLDESPPEDPHVRRWFGATPRKILRHHFELIAAGLQPIRFLVDLLGCDLCRHAESCQWQPGNSRRASAVGRSGGPKVSAGPGR